MNLWPPLLRLFGQQGFELPGSQLSQVHDLHGVYARPKDWAIHQPFYHIAWDAWCGSDRLDSSMYRDARLSVLTCASRASHPPPECLQRHGATFQCGCLSYSMGFISEFRDPT